MPGFGKNFAKKFYRNTQHHTGNEWAAVLKDWSWEPTGKEAKLKAWVCSNSGRYAWLLESGVLGWQASGKTYAHLDVMVAMSEVHIVRGTPTWTGG